MLVISVLGTQSRSIGLAGCLHLFRVPGQGEIPSQKKQGGQYPRNGHLRLASGLHVYSHTCTYPHAPVYTTTTTPMEEKEENVCHERGMFSPSHSRTVLDIVWSVLTLWLQIPIQNPGAQLPSGWPGTDCSEEALIGLCRSHKAWLPASVSREGCL